MSERESGPGFRLVGSRPRRLSPALRASPGLGHGRDPHRLASCAPKVIPKPEPAPVAEPQKVEPPKPATALDSGVKAGPRFRASGGAGAARACRLRISCPPSPAGRTRAGSPARGLGRGLRRGGGVTPGAPRAGSSAVSRRCRSGRGAPS
jgi:hypothetical protein